MNALEQRLLRRVEVLDEVDDAAGVLEDLLVRGLRALVAEADLEALVEERHLLQSLQQRLRAELDLLEHGGIGPERHDRAALLRRADSLQRPLRYAALRVRLHPLRPVAVDLELQTDRQRVHDGDADAVQPAGDLVAVAAELPARVQRRHDDLGGGLLLVVGVWIDRDPPTVVDHTAPAVGQQGHLDAGRLARHRLVDGVVDHLVHEMVEPRRSGRSDVHPGTFTDGLEPLEDRDVLHGVVRLLLRRCSRRARRTRLPVRTGALRRRRAAWTVAAGRGAACGADR